MLEIISPVDFENLPDRRIVVAFADSLRTLEVTAVDLLRPNPSRASPAFSVLLRDNGALASMPQDTYIYLHPLHGSLPLFTMPRGPDGEGMCYEVVFN